eukprot:3033116-Prymnesium_polylepis.1
MSRSASRRKTTGRNPRRPLACSLEHTGAIYLAAVALGLVNPSQLDNAPTGRHLAAEDVRPRTFVLV